MWVARDKIGYIYLYKDKPIKLKELGIWNKIDHDSHSIYRIFKEENWMFSNIKWEDDEPTEVELKIKK